jgi:hypothetical protein
LKTKNCKILHLKKIYIVLVENCIIFIPGPPPSYRRSLLQPSKENIQHFKTSVPDPDPNPDPRVFGLPDPDPLVRGMDPDPDPALDPDPSIIKQI